jgi:plasmid stability protein
MNSSEQKLLTVRVDADFHQQLKVRTAAHGTNLTDVVRGLLAHWLESHPLEVKKAKEPKKEGKDGKEGKRKKK